jgi:uncharacterized membrane protein YebE (DUF533 family)
MALLIMLNGGIKVIEVILLKKKITTALVALLTLTSLIVAGYVAYDKYQDYLYMKAIEDENPYNYNELD